ncbi:MAG: hypothetical protein IJG13_04080 [Kiritimatiellae bacterium]|nr:hypothetical protein [Kiritimatiellia bacterium]
MGQVKMIAVCAVVALGAGTAFAARWTNFTANTPDTAYLWSDPSNWQDGAVGGEGDSITNAPSAKIYVRKDTSSAPARISSSNDKVFLLGGLTVRQTSTVDANIVGGINIYGDIAYDVSSKMCYVSGNANYCGRVSHNGGESQRIAVASGGAKFNFNRYANAAGETRTDDLDNLNYFWIGNGTVTFTAPDGADATNGTWRIAEGSPFAYRVSSIAHPLAVGTIVTSEGNLEDGTYLKHVFDNATIELSAPATQSGEVTLNFAAFTPNFTATFKNRFGFQGGGPAIECIKKRQSDIARIVIPDLYGQYNLANPTIGCAAGYLPCPVVIKKFSGTWANGLATLRNVHFELANNASADSKLPFQISDSSPVVRFTVTNNLSSSIAVMRIFNGTIAKDGAGALSIGFDRAANNGSITVEGGTFTIVKNDAAGDGTIAFGNMTLAGGTTLSVPASGIRVATLKTSGNVTISGGKVTVVNGTDRSGINFSGITLSDGAQLEFVVDGEPEDVALLLGNATPQVVGHPAFWVDASKSETIVYETENGTNFVTRWNDCREGEPMFCTNANATVRATYTNGSDMAHKYVRIANCPNEKDMRNMELLVWSVPIRGIKAVFLVQDPSEGGGTVLGRCGWRLPDSLYGNSWGGPFYRETSLDWTKPIVQNSTYTIPAVLKGRFYLNGKQVSPWSPYLGAYMQLLDFHANTNYAASTGVIDCDAFGGCYHNGVDATKNKNGGMRIAEYIIYTNSLSHAERVQVAQYLYRKWLGTNNSYDLPADPSNTGDPAGIASVGGAINVPGGKTTAISTVTSGSLTKSGEGTLYVNGLDAGASLNVEGGSVTLAAMTRQRYVPTDAWIHVDAMDEDTVKTNGESLTRWNDVNGSLASYRDFSTGKVKVVQDGINGHPAIDLGPVKAWADSANSQSASLVYYTPGGQVSPNYAIGYLDQMSAPYVRTAFVVYNSSAGGGPLLGGGNDGYPSKGLPHRHSNGDASPIIDEPGYVANSGHGLPALSNAVAKGTAIFRRNGVAVDPFKATFLKGDERVTFAYSTGRKTTHLGWYGYSGCYGGLKYGEVALFDRTLNATEIASTEAYLAKKWFDIDTPGYGSAAGAVSVGAGASLTILGEDFSATSLGGAGTVTGDVTLADNGGIAAVVKEDGTIDGTTVSGTVHLDGGTVSLAGAVSNLVPGTYTILSADAIVDGGGLWTLPTLRRFLFSISFTGTEVRLTVSKHGLMMLVK